MSEKLALSGLDLAPWHQVDLATLGRTDDALKNVKLVSL